MMKYVYVFFAIIIGFSNFFYAWTAPAEQFWMTMGITALVFMVTFGQFAFNKPGEESAVFFLQLASMGFLLFGACNVAMIT